LSYTRGMGRVLAGSGLFPHVAITPAGAYFGGGPAWGRRAARFIRRALQPPDLFGRARQAHAKRLHREFQRQVPGRVLERTLVPDFAPGPQRACSLAAGLQRGETAQQL